MKTIVINATRNQNNHNDYTVIGAMLDAVYPLAPMQPVKIKAGKDAMGKDIPFQSLRSSLSAIARKYNMRFKTDKLEDESIVVVRLA